MHTLLLVLIVVLTGCGKGPSPSQTPVSESPNHQELVTKLQALEEKNKSLAVLANQLEIATGEEISSLALFNDALANYNQAQEKVRNSLETKDVEALKENLIDLTSEYSYCLNYLKDLETCQSKTITKLLETTSLFAPDPNGERRVAIKTLQEEYEQRGKQLTGITQLLTRSFEAIKIETIESHLLSDEEVEIALKHER